MAKLVDAPGLGPDAVTACRFESDSPHQMKMLIKGQKRFDEHFLYRTKFLIQSLKRSLQVNASVQQSVADFLNILTILSH